MSSVAQLWTADDLLKLPDDGYRYELIHGELKKMAPAGHVHGRIAARLIIALGQFVERNQLGLVFAAETGFRLATDHVRAPDVAFINQARTAQATSATGYWPGAPDLAIEVVSPNDVFTDVENKVVDWLNAGTRMVIVVNPQNEKVTVYRSLRTVAVLDVNDVIGGADVVPGWTLAVRTIFA